MMAHPAIATQPKSVLSSSSPVSRFTASASPAQRRLEQRLREETRCEVRFDPAARGLYATDASLYQIEPVGVVLPRSRADVAGAVRIAYEEGVAVLPRGGATSLSGQTIGRALILDCSKYLRRIGVIDRERRTVEVETGLVLDHLNAHLEPLGLMFGPDVSTSDRATIGGMIGNNSAGARSLKYGKMVDHVETLQVVLDDGTPATFGPLDESQLAAMIARDDRVGRLHRVVAEVVERNRVAIEAAFPRILRRVSGYNLDEFVPGLPVRPAGWPIEPFRFNLARLIVGSEGTLAVAVAATLKLMPKPKAQGLVILSFATLIQSLESVGEIVETGPASVELVDRTILDLAARNPEYARYLTFVEGRPEAVLAAQFHAESDDELRRMTDRLEHRFHGRAGVLGVRVNLKSSSKDDFWKVRKAGLSLLMGMVGDAKPVAFVEDTAVDPTRLPEFYRRFQAILHRHGTVGSCYGHADVGCLHIRPVLNTKDPRDVEKLRSIAREVADLVAEFGGAMSGEHGDGLARSGWNQRLFGPTVYAAFQTVKQAFDPLNRLNPGKVVAQPDPGADLRQGPDYHVVEPADLMFDYADQGGFARAVEMCSGVGVCRKTDSGTMCPSYMVTRDEDHSTRGRANLLRLVLSGALPADGLASDDLDAALDLCLGCKACKTECPSNVDLAKLKAETLYQRYQVKPPKLGARLMARLHEWYPLASALAPIVNSAARLKMTRRLNEWLLQIDHRRVLPAFVTPGRTFRAWFARHRRELDQTQEGGTARIPQGKVILLDDCFTNWHTPSVGIAAVRLLEAAGYQVELAGIPCCGRPAVSKGVLDVAKRLAEVAVDRLEPRVADGTPILGCEPSCLATLADEFRDFKIGPRALTVAQAARMADAFLADPSCVPVLPLRAPEAGEATTIHLHGHCQQKALWGNAASLTALKRAPGVRVEALDSGCCGMAGSFGYEVGHYELSRALADRVLLPAVTRAAQSSEIEVVAPGFSCRSQIKDFHGQAPRHPLEWLASRLESPSTST